MSAKMTHEEFVEKLNIKNQHFANGEFVLTGLYNGNKNKIGCHCNIHNYDWHPVSGSLLNGHGCPECGRFSRWDWKRWTHDEFVEAVSLIGKNVKVLDEYTGYEASIRFMCEHGHVWNTTPHSVLSGHGCPYCAGLMVWVGFNDLWTTRPDVAQLLTNPNDGYLCTYGSLKMLDFTCPDCGNIESKQVAQISRYGMSCSRCSDGVSYPNKFARAVLDQLSLDYHKCEYCPDWAKPYFYDNYFVYNGVEYILEMDGGFYYKEVVKSDRTLEEVRRIDKIKTSLAIQRGINVIRIECLDSSCDYIKQNMLSSELNKIFDLSNINWNLCDQKAQKSLVKEACNLYMSKTRDLNDIAVALHIHNSTVRNYLKRGAACGWCDYDSIIAKKVRTERMSKPIVIVDDYGNILYTFNSIRGCERDMMDKYGIAVYRKSIQQSLQTYKPYKGFNFRFANETTQN